MDRVAIPVDLDLPFIVIYDLDSKPFFSPDRSYLVVNGVRYLHHHCIPPDQTLCTCTITEHCIVYYKIPDTACSINLCMSLDPHMSPCIVLHQDLSHSLSHTSRIHIKRIGFGKISTSSFFGRGCFCLYLYLLYACYSLSFFIIAFFPAKCKRIIVHTCAHNQ